MKRMLVNPKVLGALLVLSVAANLFFGSLVLGRLTGEAAYGPQAKRSIEALLEALPAERRPILRQELRTAMPEMRRNLQAAQALRAELAKELIKPEPDPAQLDRYFSELRQRTTAMQSALQQAYKRAALQLTLEERRAVIDALKRRARPQSAPDF
jgi:uncharacterized membrane protein